jgi:type II secretory pathway predicted ATPase ExeA
MPFDKSIKVGELYSSYDAGEVSARLEYIKQYRGILLLTGEPGSGKTAMLRKFVHHLNPASYEHCYSPHSTISRTELYRQLNSLLKLPTKASKSALFDQVQGGLWDLYKNQGKVPCLILDECHLMDDNTLQELVLLTNFEMDSQMPLILILSGLHELSERLKRRRHESLNQRVSLRYHMGGMDLTDTKNFIVHHLRIAGRSDALFDDSAYEVISKLAMGLPRKVGNLCLSSMTLAALKGVSSIDGDIVHKAMGGL